MVYRRGLLKHNTITRNNVFSNARKLIIKAIEMKYEFYTKIKKRQCKAISQLEKLVLFRSYH